MVEGTYAILDRITIDFKKQGLTNLREHSERRQSLTSLVIVLDE